MAIEALATSAEEQSSYIITLSFANEESVAVAPNSASWSLTTLDGTVVNGRKDIAITPLASTVDIVLSGEDLAVETTEDSIELMLTVKAAYTSSEYGELPLTGAVTFDVDNLKGL